MVNFTIQFFFVFFSHRSRRPQQSLTSLTATRRTTSQQPTFPGPPKNQSRRKRNSVAVEKRGKQRHDDFMFKHYKCASCSCFYHMNRWAKHLRPVVFIKKNSYSNRTSVFKGLFIKFQFLFYSLCCNLVVTVNTLFNHTMITFPTNKGMSDLPCKQMFFY